MVASRVIAHFVRFEVGSLIQIQSPIRVNIEYAARGVPILCLSQGHVSSSYFSYSSSNHDLSVMVSDREFVLVSFDQEFSGVSRKFGIFPKLGQSSELGQINCLKLNMFL